MVTGTHRAHSCRNCISRLDSAIFFERVVRVRSENTLTALQGHILRQSLFGMRISACQIYAGLAKGIELSLADCFPKSESIDS